MRDKPLAVYHELIAPRLAPKDGVILQHETWAVRSRLAVEEQRGRQSADAAAHHHTIKLFPGVAAVRGKLVENPVPDSMGVGHHGIGVAVRAAVITDAAIAVPIILR